MSSQAQHYFGAGPAALPYQVKQQVQQDVLNYQNSGISIMELSHRSEAFLEIINQSKKMLRDIYALPDQYKILFMAGGATLQFDAIPLNLAGGFNHACYLDTGFWSRRSGQLASKHVDVKYIEGVEICEGKLCCKQAKYWQPSSNSAYLHVTPNETISGVEFVSVGDIKIPVVADLTSCILMQELDVSEFDVMYAATQKSLGISGLSVIIIHEDLLERVSEKTPDLLRYDLHVNNNSIVNTAPVFACYVTNLMLQWVKQQGGLTAMVKLAKQRAALIYEAVDRSNYFSNMVCDQNRSSINVVFDAYDPKSHHVQKLIELAEKEGLRGLQGHRSVGGVRASMYNGTPLEAVYKLADLINMV